MKLRAVAAVCATVLAFGVPFFVKSTALADREATWLAASDIHLDPFDRSPRASSMGSDSNIALLNSALREMKAVDPNPDVILLPGDFFAHHFAQVSRREGGMISVSDAGTRTMQRIASAFNRAFPKAQFAIALGNNDAPCGDYKSDFDDAFIRATARIWAPMVDRGGAAPGFVRTFSHGGYYTARLPVSGLRLVVLNSVPFSSRYGGACGGGAAATAAADQLAWLKATLRATPRGTRNLVLMHIPPGYDEFTTEITGGFLRWPFMKVADGAALVDALSRPENRVAYAIAGHEHHFGFRFAGGVPIVILGSISPIFDNNPAFYALVVGGDGTLRDVAAYAFDQRTQAWFVPPSFDRMWNVDRVDASTLARIHQRLGEDPTMRQAWDAASSALPSIRSSRWRFWGDRVWRIPWCAQTVLTADFVRCARIERRMLVAWPALIAVALAALALLILLLSRAMWVKRRTPPPVAR
jgi:hypothetical protein